MYSLSSSVSLHPRRKRSLSLQCWIPSRSKGTTVSLCCHAVSILPDPFLGLPSDHSAIFSSSVVLGLLPQPFTYAGLPTGNALLHYFLLSPANFHQASSLSWKSLPPEILLWLALQIMHLHFTFLFITLGLNTCVSSYLVSAYMEQSLRVCTVMEFAHPGTHSSYSNILWWKCLNNTTGLANWLMRPHIMIFWCRNKISICKQMHFICGYINLLKLLVQITVNLLT